MGKPTGERIVGPLLPMARGFLLELIEMGYSTTAQSKRLRLMGALSSWLAANGIDPSELTAEVISGFLAPIRVRGPEEEWFSRVGERQLVDYLRRVGLVPAPEPAVVTDPMERLVGSLVEYLVRERGLKDGSSRVQEYRQTTRLFLAGRLDGYGGGFDRLTASDVTTFVVTECRHRSPRMSVGLASSLRGLLRFLFIEGLTPIDLTGAVPKVPGWRCASLPRALAAGDVARLLDSCDRTSAVGRRDFAILIMLSRLGVRGCEVARLRLSDVDWSAGELIVRGKGDCHERLPLPTVVGAALVDYLRHGRPAWEDPHFFLTARAPFKALTGGAGALGAVRSACRRAGLARVGAHSLRHTVATEALRAGAPLEEVASLLRHRSHATTVIYAKVDWERLRELARPWPGSGS